MPGTKIGLNETWNNTPGETNEQKAFAISGD